MPHQRYDYTCLWCENKYISRYKQSTYCSKLCQSRHHHKKTYKPRWERKVRNCTVCENSFIPNQLNQKYCSRNCQNVFNKIALKKTQTHKRRFEVLERDRFTCKYCGASPRKNKDVKLHVDHMKPKRYKGTDDLENLITSCAYCNLGKGQQFYPNIFKWDYK